MKAISDKKMVYRFLRRTAIGGLPLGVLMVVMLYFYFFVRPDMVGDLGELGKLRFDRNYTIRMYEPILANDMPVIYTPGDCLCRIVTIGDSFSLQRPNGYQSFLSDILGEPVSNIVIDRSKATPEQALSDMINSGFFDSHTNVQYVILQTIEREIIDRWNIVDTTTSVKEFPISVSGEEKDNRGFIGRIFNQSLDWIKLSTGLEKNPVKSLQLSKKCFTERGKEDILYFYYEDLNCLAALDAEIEGIAEKLIDIQKRLENKGIKLLYMIAPDKYELYRPLAVDDQYPVKELGTQLLRLDSLNFVVNPLPDLRDRLNDGVTDLFMADDTHWSSKAAEIAARKIADKIKDSYQR